jgi:anti-anti-sigma regulatory factor
MALGIATSKIDEVIVVRLERCPSLLARTQQSLGTHVKELLQNSRQIALDLRTVTSIDSGGLGLFASVRKVGGEIKVAEVSPHPKA